MMVATLLWATSGTVVGDTIVIDASLVPAPDGPRRGATMVEVEQSLGAPTTKAAPVGDPPITVWTYPGFTVYFEYDKVLHSVTRVGQQ